MRILITGGLGFAGSTMIHYLLETYPDVRIVNMDKMTYAGNLDNVSDIASDPRYFFVKGDISDQQAVEDVFSHSPFDVVLNYAAETHVDRSIMDPRAFLYTDVIGTFTLLEAAKRHHTALFIQISTDEVFGSIAQGEFSEQSSFAPNSPYAASKAGADHICRAYFKTYGVPVVVTHSCNYIGPYQYPEKMISLFITNLLENIPAPLYGDGENIREWIFTRDHCTAIDTIMHKGTPGDAYMIGSGNRLSNRQVLLKILAILGKGEDMIRLFQDRPGHDWRYAVDSSKLRSLGWAPAYDFDDALSATIAWYQKNTAWWKKIKSGEYWEYYRAQYGDVGICARGTSRALRDGIA